MSNKANLADRPWMDPDAQAFIRVQSVSKLFGDFTTEN